MKRLCKIVFLTAALINPAFMYTDQIKPLLDVAGDRQKAEKAWEAFTLTKVIREKSM